jgi:hypothetical protein
VNRAPVLLVGLEHGGVNVAAVVRGARAGVDKVGPVTLVLEPRINEAYLTNLHEYIHVTF